MTTKSKKALRVSPPAPTKPAVVTFLENGFRDQFGPIVRAVLLFDRAAADVIAYPHDPSAIRDLKKARANFAKLKAETMAGATT